MSGRLIILGASGHGKVAADIAMRSGYEEILFLDDSPQAGSCLGWPVLGPVSEAEGLQGEFFVAIGNPAVRARLQNRLEGQGKVLATLIHPSAVLAAGVRVGRGSVLMAGVIVNPCVEIGAGCILNTAATVDHDCRLGDYVHVSVGAHLAGTVTVGARSWIGVGAAVVNNVSIASDCMIGAGATVVRSVTEAGTYVGTPARKIK